METSAAEMWDRRMMLVRRNSPFPITHPPYGERCLILGRLQELGAPRDALKALGDWSSELQREEAGRG